MHMMSVCVEGSYESSKDFIRDILDFRTLIEWAKIKYDIATCINFQIFFVIVLW